MVYQEDGFGATIGAFGGGVQVMADTYSPDPYDHIEEIPIAYGYTPSTRAPQAYVEDVGGAVIGAFGGGVSTHMPTYNPQPLEDKANVEQQFEEVVMSGITDSPAVPAVGLPAQGGFSLGGLMPMLMLMMVMKND